MASNFILAIAAVMLLAVASIMLMYEFMRVRSKRPLFRGRETITLYWVIYLSLYVLGMTSGVAALVRQ